MSLRLASLVLLVTLGALTACTTKNPLHVPDAGGDATTACTGPSDCTNSAEPVCKLPAGVCVACTASEPGACAGTAPVCDEDTNRCAACSAHRDCPDSAACLPDGSCADPATVAYVGPAGSGTACSRTSPCATLDAAVTANKPYIKFASGLVKDTNVTTIDGKVVTILAEADSTLDRDGDGAILVVRSTGADVRIFDLRITGASGVAGAHGIELQPNGGAPTLRLTRVKIDANQGSGISSAGGTLTVTQSTVSGNQGGGISVSGTGATFDLTNNFIFRNGDQDVGTFGGIRLDVAVAGTSRMEFNTIVDNRASSGAIRAGGVICDITGFAAPNNVIARNAVGGNASAPTAQTLGICTYPTTTIQADVAQLAFKRPDEVPFDYRLGPNSSAIDQATTPSTIVVDVDGEPRPKGDEKDRGAHEF